VLVGGCRREDDDLGAAGALEQLGVELAPRLPLRTADERQRAGDVGPAPVRAVAAGDVAGGRLAPALVFRASAGWEKVTLVTAVAVAAMIQTLPFGASGRGPRSTPSR
jgi:hypothetical protein